MFEINVTKNRYIDFVFIFGTEKYETVRRG